MKKTIYILLTALLSLTLIGAKAQETPPSGLKSVNAQFYIHLPDSSVWQNKGLPYGYQRAARYKDVLLNRAFGNSRMDSLFARSVDLYTAQTVGGNKTFTGAITYFNNALSVYGIGEFNGRLIARTTLEHVGTDINTRTTYSNGLGTGNSWYTYFDGNDLIFNRYTGASLTGVIKLKDNGNIEDGAGKAFLKAGSVPDSTTISATYVKKAGGTMTGNLTLPSQKVEIAGQALTDYNNTLYNVPGHVGIVGNPELNVSWNMNYNKTGLAGVHLYDNPIYPAIWTAHGSNGYYIQMAHANQTQTGFLRASVVGGSGYTDGIYNIGVGVMQNLTGTGSGANATVYVSGGRVTQVVPGVGGAGYAVGDTFTVPAANIGGTGSGFVATITYIGNDIWVQDGLKYMLALSLNQQLGVGFASGSTYGDARIVSRRLGTEANIAGYSGGFWIEGNRQSGLAGDIHLNALSNGGSYLGEGGGSSYITDGGGTTFINRNGGKAIFGTSSSQNAAVLFNNTYNVPVLPGSPFGRILYNQGTLNATEANQTLIGYDGVATFNDNGYTGINHIEARFRDKVNMLSLTASAPVFTDASKNLVSSTITGSGPVVLQTGASLLGVPTAPTAAVGTNTQQLSTMAALFNERSATSTITNKTVVSPVLTNVNYASTFKTAAGAAGTDSVAVIAAGGILKRIPANYYSTAGSGASLSATQTFTGVNTFDQYIRLFANGAAGADATHGAVSHHTDGSFVFVPNSTTTLQPFKLHPTATSGGTVTLDLPVASGTLQTLNGVETVTNKTLTTPKLTGYTVATLPAGTIGMMAYVTDALTPSFLTVVTGGGSIVTPVFYNGTAWVSY